MGNFLKSNNKAFEMLSELETSSLIGLTNRTDEVLSV